MKPIVRFVPHPNNIIVLGVAAFVEALDHPKLGHRTVRTSRVVKLNPDGSFETLNTLYVPAVEDSCEEHF